jgi:hypothetical protein
MKERLLVHLAAVLLALAMALPANPTTWVAMPAAPHGSCQTGGHCGD